MPFFALEQCLGPMNSVGLQAAVVDVGGTVSGFVEATMPLGNPQCRRWHFWVGNARVMNYWKIYNIN
jgi:hypothetical protein